MADLTKTIKLNILGDVYELSFPKTGQFIDIQTIKAKMTEGHYGTFKMLERDGLMANIIVDAIATFNVMIGQKLRENLNVPGLMELDLGKIIEIAYTYKDVYLPWYEQWIEIVSTPKNKAETTSKETVV